MLRIMFMLLASLLMTTHIAAAPLATAGGTNANDQLDYRLRKQEVEDIVDRAVDRNVKSLVEKEVTAKEDERFKQLSWIVAFIGLIGIGTFGTLAKYLIETAVEQRLEKRTGEISSALDFSRFYLLTLKLEFGDGFTQEDVDAIMNYLRKVEKNSNTRHSKEFISALFQVMHSFAAASQSASLDELFVSYEQEILSAPTLVQPLLHHYGQEIVGRDIAPADDVGYRAFEKLERVSTSSRVPELALAYRTLFESRKSAPDSDKLIYALLTSSTKLPEEDRTRYLHEILLRTKAENWMHRVTKEGYMIQVQAREFVSKYKRALFDLYRLDEAQADHIANDGISVYESKLLAQSLASSVPL